MSGGDLLYILAFIILPTAVLVSCIWALILLRKGVLLPVRSVPTHDPADVTLDDLPAAVEETGEHAVVEVLPATATEVVDISAEADSQPEASPAQVIEPTGKDIPPTERTQEMDVLADGVVMGPVQPIEQVSESVAVQDSDPITDDTPPVQVDASDPLLIPLDEPRREPRPNDENDATQPDVADARPPKAGPRRPARRIAPTGSSTDAPARPRVRAGQRRDGRRTGDDA